MRRLVIGVIASLLLSSNLPSSVQAVTPSQTPMDQFLTAFVASQPSSALVPLLVPSASRGWFLLNSHATPRQIGTLPFWTVNVSAPVALSAIGRLGDGMVLANRLTPKPAPMAVENSTVASDPAKITGADLIQLAGNSGAGQSVAVIDTGIQPDHPMFTDGAGGTRVLPQQACFVTDPAAAEFPCLNGLASDTSNGSADISSDVFLAENGYEHGTHVAGIIAGRKPASPAWVVSGIAPDANIVAVRVFGHAAGAYDSDILAGLSWVRTNAAALNITAVNLSLGGTPTPDDVCLTANAAYETAFASLVTAGVAPAVAAGNDSNQTMIAPPGCVPSAISVGSTNANDSVSAFSNVSASLDLMAPGNLVGSSVPMSKWAIMSGTSMATPVVAAAFALAHKADPTRSVASWLATFKATGTPVSATVISNIPRISISNALSQYAGLQAPSTVNAVWPDFMNYTLTWTTPPLGPVPTGYRITDGATVTDVGADVRTFSGTFTSVNHVVTIASLNGAEVSPPNTITIAPQLASVHAVTATNSPLVEIADFCSSPTSPVLKLRYNSPVLATRALWALTGDGRAQLLNETALSPVASPFTALYAKEISIVNPVPWLTAAGRIYYANAQGVVGNSLSLSNSYSNVVSNPLVPAAPSNLLGTGSYERATISWDAGTQSLWRVLVDGAYRTTLDTNSAQLALTPGVHTISVCGVAMTSNGTYTTGTYYSRRADVEVTVSPKLVQSLQVSAPTDISLNNPTAQITASATSLLPVTYTSQTPLVCTVNTSGLVTALIGGACTVAVGQAGNADFAAAQTVLVTINVAKVDQSIAFTGPTLVPLGGGGVQINAASSSGLALAYATTTPDICTITSGGIVSGLAVGTCTVEISQAGSSSYNPATSITVDLIVKLGQVLSAEQLPDMVLGTPDAQITASTTSGLQISYTSLTSLICSVSSTGLVSVLSAGDCQIEISQAGDATYAPAAVIVMTVRIRATQTVSASAASTIVMTSPQAQITASSTSGLGLTFATTTPSVCAVSSSGLITALSAGECSVTVSQAGSTTYAAASTTVVLMVMRATQTITAPNSLTAVIGAAAVSIGGTSSAGLALAYTSLTPQFCLSSSSGVITAVALGDCQVQISQAGTTIYAPASDITLVVAIRNGQTITASQLNGLILGTSATIAASSSSGLGLTFTSGAPLVCAVDGSGRVTTLMTGTCQIRLSQTGDSVWAATEKLISFVVVAPRPTVVTKVVAVTQIVSATTAKVKYTWARPLNKAFSLPTAYVIKWRTITASGTASAWKQVTITKQLWYSPILKRGLTLVVQIAASGPGGVGPVVKTSRKL